MKTNMTNFSISSARKRKKFIKSMYMIGPIMLLLAITMLSPSALACEGQDYQRTLQVQNYSIRVGYEFGMTGDINLFQQRLQEINNYIQQLPQSCQFLLQQMGAGFSSGGSSGTTCMGGVCCDSTGCY